MPIIHLTTFVEAAAQIVFNLSRSVEVHQMSMHESREKAIAGVTRGLLNEGDSVTWQARHLFKMRKLETTITAMKCFEHFRDEMVTGDFKCMKHDHYFKQVENGTIMIDIFAFESPFGVFGRLLDKLYLHTYMRKLLRQRNEHIKIAAETGAGKQVLDHSKEEVER